MHSCQSGDKVHEYHPYFRCLLYSSLAAIVVLLKSWGSWIKWIAGKWHTSDFFCFCFCSTSIAFVCSEPLRRGALISVLGPWAVQLVFSFLGRMSGQQLALWWPQRSMQSWYHQQPWHQFRCFFYSAQSSLPTISWLQFPCYPLTCEVLQYCVQFILVFLYFYSHQSQNEHIKS